MQAGEVRCMPVRCEIFTELLELLLLEHGEHGGILGRSFHKGVFCVLKAVQVCDGIAHVHINGSFAPDGIFLLHFLPAGEAVAGDGTVAEGGVGSVLPNVLRGGGKRDHAAQTERHGDRQQQCDCFAHCLHFSSS